MVTRSGVKVGINGRGQGQGSGQGHGEGSMPGRLRSDGWWGKVPFKNS